MCNDNTKRDDEPEAIDPHDRVRARTISIKRLSKRELERGRELFPETDYDKPRTRFDCTQGEHAARPCPFVSCRYHLYLDVSARTGAIKLNFPDLEPDQLPESCALDVAENGGMTLEDLGAIVNLTRERVRQIETQGLARLKALNDLAALQDLCEPEPERWTAAHARVRHIAVGIAWSQDNKQEIGR